MSIDQDETTPNGGGPSCSEKPRDLAWTQMTKRFHTDVQKAAIGRWIESDLEVLEAELADFQTPQTFQRQRR